MTREQPKTWQEYLDCQPTEEELAQQNFENGMDHLPEETEEEKEGIEEEEREITARAIENLL